MSANAGPRVTPDAASAAVPSTDGRDVTRPVPFWRAARAVFDLSLEGMLWSRRSLLMALLLAVPAILSVLVRFASSRLPPQLGSFDFYGQVVAFYYIQNALPIVALFYSTALIADEVEAKTITYLLTRPIARLSVLAGKFGAYVATTLSIALPPVVVTFFLLMTIRGWSGLGAYVPDLLRDAGVVALTLVSYGALFTLLGVVLRQPVLPGLIFLFVWEKLVVNFLAQGYMPRLTVTAYLRSLIHHQVTEETVLGSWGGQVLPTALCLEAVGAMIVVFLAGAAWIFSQREYVLDQ